MSNVLQQQHIGMATATEIMLNLKDLFGEQNRTTRLIAIKGLVSTKIVEGTPVMDYMLEMMGFLNELDILGAIMDAETQIDISTEDLKKVNKKSVFLAEDNVPSVSKPKGKGKRRGKGQASKKKVLVVKNKKTFKKKSTKSNDACFYCGKPGRWKRNYRSYLACKQGDKPSQGMSQVFIAETNMIGPAFFWCVDTGATSHICNVLQGLRISRRLTDDKLNLQVGSDTIVAVQAMGDYFLTFSRGYLLLKDCLYVPSIRRNLISVSKLISDGYLVDFNKSSVFIKNENSIIVEGALVDGLYLINAKKNVSNIESVPSVDVPNLKKGKVTNIPFKGKSERSESVLELTHPDVCGPLSHPASGGFLYFVTFTDDHSSRNATFLEEEFIQDAGEMERIALEEQSDDPIERYEKTELYVFQQGLTLVDSPEGIKPIGCKWIFKRKKGPDGKVETYKARLLAKDYTQKAGIDFEETFSPIAMLKSIRILLAIAAHYDYEIWQMDVKTAFLNGNIQDDIYMVQPEGFEAAEEDNHKVCKLQRSIYGLKQTSHN
ncbi:uncharacterized protein LOC143886944 [Tasmannia lanceolata]|uniref:uncharacterized protein LOC143886944 n=1 Tax=Tasmannia lanceolata TaxID=3420 RepID=UPI00406303E9